MVQPGPTRSTGAGWTAPIGMVACTNRTIGQGSQGIALPSIRATQAKSDLIAIDGMEPAVRDRVLARLASGIVRQIQEASRVDWIPMSVILELSRVIREETDEEGVRAWGKAATAISLDTPLLRPILQGATAVFGSDPQRLYKALPTAWVAVFKDCGTLVIEGGEEGCIRIAVRDMPESVRDRDFLLACAGGFEVVLEQCRVEGRCDPENAQRAEGPRFVVRWRPRA